MVWDISLIQQLLPFHCLLAHYARAVGPIAMVRSNRALDFRAAQVIGICNWLLANLRRLLCALRGGGNQKTISSWVTLLTLGAFMRPRGCRGSERVLYSVLLTTRHAYFLGSAIARDLQVG